MLYHLILYQLLYPHKLRFCRKYFFVYIFYLEPSIDCFLLITGWSINWSINLNFCTLAQPIKCFKFITSLLNCCSYLINFSFLYKQQSALVRNLFQCVYNTRASRKAWKHYSTSFTFVTHGLFRKTHSFDCSSLQHSIKGRNNDWLILIWSLRLEKIWVPHLFIHLRLKV